jgi:hypothetical protein
MTTQTFLQQMKTKCKAKAKQMASLELSVWNYKHESELKSNFGFTNKQLTNRRKELNKKANA